MSRRAAEGGSFGSVALPARVRGDSSWFTGNRTMEETMKWERPDTNGGRQPDRGTDR